MPSFSSRTTGWKDATRVAFKCGGHLFTAVAATRFAAIVSTVAAPAARTRSCVDEGRAGQRKQPCLAVRCAAGDSPVVRGWRRHIGQGLYGAASMTATREMAPASWFLQSVILIVAIVPWQSASADMDTAAMSQSLEPRQVYPFRRYGDVTLLPFVVAQGTHSATWTFKANISSHCRPDIVHLMQGLPVLSPLNASFPDGFVTKRQRLRSLYFPTDSELRFINITSPDPGQWFAAAFTLDHHQRILQKGLFAPCEVYLSSSLTPYLLDEVVDLLPGQATTHHVVKPTYFRFATSRELWSLDFNISECKFQGNSTADSCPVIISASAEVLPAAQEDDAVDAEVVQRNYHS
ncbi:hypothetical protein MRX96_009286 [Rhipicephalus microplus]